jgi:hypothetical protein
MPFQGFLSHEVVQQNHRSTPDPVAVSRKLSDCFRVGSDEENFLDGRCGFSERFQSVTVEYLISNLICRLELLVGLIRPGIIE